MDNLYKFDEYARTERYFVGTLFTHLLMAKEFELIKILLKKYSLMTSQQLKKAKILKLYQN
jgi:hypothetical protein